MEYDEKHAVAMCYKCVRTIAAQVLNADFSNVDGRYIRAWGKWMYQ